MRPAVAAHRGSPGHRSVRVSPYAARSGDGDRSQEEVGAVRITERRCCWISEPPDAAAWLQALTSDPSARLVTAQLPSAIRHPPAYLTESLVAHCTLWAAAAVVGLVTSIGVWLLLRAIALLNDLTFGWSGSLPAP